MFEESETLVVETTEVINSIRTSIEKDGNLRVMMISVANEGLVRYMSYKRNLNTVPILVVVQPTLHWSIYEKGDITTMLELPAKYAVDVQIQTVEMFLGRYLRCDVHRPDNPLYLHLMTVGAASNGYINECFKPLYDLVRNSNYDYELRCAHLHQIRKISTKDKISVQDLVLGANSLIWMTESTKVKDAYYLPSDFIGVELDETEFTHLLEDAVKLVAAGADTIQFHANKRLFNTPIDELDTWAEQLTGKVQLFQSVIDRRKKLAEEYAKLLVQFL